MIMLEIHNHTNKWTKWCLILSNLQPSGNVANMCDGKMIPNVHEKHTKIQVTYVDQVSVVICCANK